MLGDELRWVASRGGPLLLMPGELLPSWGGIKPPPDGRSITATFRWGSPDDPASDYDRACDVDGYLGLIDVGDGQGLILGGEPDVTAWHAFAASGDGNGTDGGIVIRCEYTDSDSDADIIADVVQIPVSAWIDDELVLHVGREPLYLLDAADDLSSLESNNYLTMHLPAGSYSLASTQFEQTGHTRLLLHRLLRISAGSGHNEG